MRKLTELEIAYFTSTADSIRNRMVECIRTIFKDTPHDVESAAFYVLQMGINVLCNLIYDLSDNEHLDYNINEAFKSMKQWSAKRKEEPKKGTH
jgi:hypothetical protein